MKLLKLVLKNLTRRPGRTLLSIGGIGSGLLLFVHGGEPLPRPRSGLSGHAAVVGVYRKNRYCPGPWVPRRRHEPRIERPEGVDPLVAAGGTVLNNCRWTSVDLVTFSGVQPPIDGCSRLNLTVVDGDVASVYQARPSLSADMVLTQGIRDCQRAPGWNAST